MEFCRKNNIPAVDISVDITKKENVDPHFGHPNGKANKIYAAKLSEFLLNKEDLQK